MIVSGKKRVGIILTLLSALILLCIQNDVGGLRSRVIHYWFEKGATGCVDGSDIHKCSQWKYLSEEEFNEMVLDGVSQIEPALKDGDSIFEFGMGVGAAMKPLKEKMPNLKLAGSDYSASAIASAKDFFPEDKEHFYVHDMTQAHTFIADNTYDHVFSFGALGMYLSQDDMLLAIKEAARITKPGGSLLFTHFIEPGAKPRGSIVAPVEKDFWHDALNELGLEDVKILQMKHQGERYQIVCKKKDNV